MMFDDLTDAATAESLDTLLRLSPDVARARRVRERCRRRLQRRQRHPARLTRDATGRASRLLTAAVVGGFCVIYAAALVATTLRLEAILR